MGAISRIHRDLPLLVVWLVLLIVLSVLLISEQHPLRFLAESSLFVAMAEMELAFVLLVWPLWLGRSLQDSPGPREASLQAVIQSSVMFLLGLPVNLIAQALSNTTPGEFVRTCGVLLATQILVGALYVLGARLRLRLHAYFYLGLFLTQILLPFLGYLLLEFSNAESFAFLKILSPFWTIASDDTSLLPIFMMIVLAALLGTAAHRIKPIEPAVPPQ